MESYFSEDRQAILYRFGDYYYTYSEYVFHMQYLISNFTKWGYEETVIYLSEKLNEFLSGENIC